MHAFVNDLERPIGTYLYGRLMYETMIAWEDPKMLEEPLAAMRDYAAIWRGAEKVVYSRTLTQPGSGRTTIEPEFEPEAVRRLKAEAGRDISVGGPHLAAEAFAAGLVDECHVFVAPVAVGGGNRSLPDGVRVGLELLSVRSFGNGMVHLHYGVAGA